MGGTHFRLRHVVGAASLSGAMLLAGLSVGFPAAAQTAAVAITPSCPVLSVANPGPGNTIGAGDMVISGQAYDPAATSDAGITRVDLFLGRRDEGGMFLGSAVPGNIEDSPRAFRATVSIPSNFNSQVDFAAYAISSVSGTETAVSYPIFVGTQPRDPNALVTPTPDVSPAVTVTNNCPTVPAASAQAAAPAAVATPLPAAVAPSATNACPTLSLANPNPGDTLTAGNMFISGLATAPGGVERIDLFLGARDQGGMFLGSGEPGTGASPYSFNLELKVPNLGRGADFAAYVIGSNGQETVVTFPVFVGAVPTRTSVGPTPTPLPSTQTVTSTCD